MGWLRSRRTHPSKGMPVVVNRRSIVSSSARRVCAARTSKTTPSTKSMLGTLMVFFQLRCMDDSHKAFGLDSGKAAGQHINALGRGARVADLLHNTTTITQV